LGQLHQISGRDLAPGYLILEKRSRGVARDDGPVKIKDRAGFRAWLGISNVLEQSGK